jgi:cytochrome c553
MRWIVIAFIIVPIIIAAGSPMFAQPSNSGSISAGHQIAITICGNCHEVPMSSRKTSIGPKLRDIANRPSTTAQTLRDFLGYRHKLRMPNFLLSRVDTNALIVYILSLKRD